LLGAISATGISWSMPGELPGVTGAGVFFLKKLNICCDCGVIAFYETHWHFFYFESAVPLGLKWVHVGSQ
jgi:hypothetical protein